MKYIQILIIIHLVAGCAATGPIYTTPPSIKEAQARIFIYRKNVYIGSAFSNSYWVDDIEVASLRNNGYTFFSIAPGSYTLRPWGKDHTMSVLVQVEPGKSYYFRSCMNCDSLPAEKVLNSNFVNRKEYLYTDTLQMEMNYRPTFDLVKEEYAIEELLSGYKFQSPLIQKVDQ